MKSPVSIYPKLEVYCLKTKQEQDGNICLTCEFFKGTSINDFGLKDTGKSMIFFRCFYKNEAEEKENE